MLSQFRALAKTPVAKVLLAVLAASFLIWGIRDVFRNFTASDAVIQVGSRTINGPRFKQMMQDELAQYAQQSGQTISLQDAVAHNVDRQIADNLASQEAMAVYIQRIGVRPSDKQVVNEIAKAPRFFNPVSGQFDRQAYESYVQQSGFTDAQFEELLRDDLAQTQFISGMASGLRAPLLFSALQAAYAGEGRTFSYFVLPTDAVPPPAPPSDAELNAFIRAHADRLTRPEARVFTVAAFSATKLAQTLTADPAQVQKRFDFEKDTLSKPEKRSLVEIPVRSAAEGASVAARLAKNENPQAVAASLHVPPVVYADSPKSAVADKKLAEIAFAMAPGQVKGPVQGDLGLAVLKLSAVTPGQDVTLAEVRPKIEQEVKLSQAQVQITKDVQKYEDARSGGASLANAAKAAGAVVTTLPAITDKGATLQNQQVNMPPKLLASGFALKAGQDGDIVDLGPGEYAALRLENVMAPSLTPLDDLRAQLTPFVRQQDGLKLLKVKADAIAAAVSKGQTLQAAAAANHVQVVEAKDVMRSEGDKTAAKTYSDELLGRLFLAKPGDVVTALDVKPGYVMARLEADVPASAQTAAQTAADQRQAVSQAMAQDFANALRLAATQAVKPKINYQKARQALGVDAGAPAQ